MTRMAITAAQLAAAGAAWALYTTLSAQMDGAQKVPVLAAGILFHFLSNSFFVLITSFWFKERMVLSGAVMGFIAVIYGLLAQVVGADSCIPLGAALTLSYIWGSNVHVSYVHFLDGRHTPYRIALKMFISAHEHTELVAVYPEELLQRREKNNGGGGGGGGTASSAFWKIRSHPGSGWAPTMNCRRDPKVDAPVSFLFRVHDLVEGPLKTVQGAAVGAVPQDSNLPKGECTICLSMLSEFGRCCSLECGHAFHVTCVERWVGKNGNCPLCRRAAKKPAEASKASKKNELRTPEFIQVAGGWCRLIFDDRQFLDRFVLE